MIKKGTGSEGKGQMPQLWLEAKMTQLGLKPGPRQEGTGETVQYVCGRGGFFESSAWSPLQEECIGKEGSKGRVQQGRQQKKAKEGEVKGRGSTAYCQEPGRGDLPTLKMWHSQKC